MTTFRAEYKLKGQLVVIRNAEPEDASAMIALINQLDTESTFLSREPGEFSFTEEQERAYIQTHKESQNSRLLVAEIAGRIVGSAGTEFGKGNRQYMHAGSVSIAVAKACWGMNIGRVLMEENIRWLSQNGVEKVNLTVDTQNVRAVSLYQKLGFVIEGRQMRERKLADGSYREAYWMGLLLPGADPSLEVE